MFMRLLVTLLVIGTGFIFGYITAASSFDTYDAVQKTVDFQDKLSDKVAEITGNEKVKTYTSEYGFAFTYATSFHLENAHVAIPGRDFIRAVGIMRYVPISWCPNALRTAECAPFLENPGIAFGVIDKERSSLISTELVQIASFLEKVIINEREGLQYFLGAEGEGVVTILFELPEQKTLIVQYTYDEAFEKDDYHAKGVLSTEKQKQKVDEILSTLQIKD